MLTPALKIGETVLRDAAELRALKGHLDAARACEIAADVLFAVRALNDSKNGQYLLALLQEHVYDCERAGAVELLPIWRALLLQMKRFVVCRNIEVSPSHLEEPGPLKGSSSSLTKGGGDA